MSDDNTIELNRRRVLGGIVTVGGAAAAAGAGTFALFSDTESSNGNTISAGTLDLQSPSVSGDFPVTGLVPGDTVSGSVTATYDGDSSVDPVNVTVALSMGENDVTTTPTDNQTNLSVSEFAQRLEVTQALLANDDGSDTYDILSSSTQTTFEGSTYTSLDDVVSHSVPSDALSDVSPGNTVSLSLDATFVSSAGNDAQGDGIDLDVTFEAEQTTN